MPPFTSWFKGGKTNICYNALDRNVASVVADGCVALGGCCARLCDADAESTNTNFLAPKSKARSAYLTFGTSTWVRQVSSWFPTSMILLASDNCGTALLLTTDVISSLESPEL